MSYTRSISIALGTSKTSLALQAQLTTDAGVDTGSPITAGFTELGGGTYLWKYAAFADRTTYGVKFADQAAPSVVLASTVVEPDPSTTTAGAGAVLKTFTLVHSVTGAPLDGVEAWVTTGSDPAVNVVASFTSGSDGVVTFMLDPGSYHLWQQIAGFNTPSGSTFTVT